jgi:formamidopyrimidine-DNA glycosylase
MSRRRRCRADGGAGTLVPGAGTGARSTSSDQYQTPRPPAGLIPVSGTPSDGSIESLHRACIHPARPAGSIGRAGARWLHAAIRDILRAAVDSGGTSFADYLNDARSRASYLDHAEVFRRQGRPCGVCGTLITRTKVAGRTTNFCPHCQQP